MSEPFLAEIKIVSFGFPPKGWAACDGQLLPIAQNQALFALMGTTYGGNGQTTFALPDLRGRTAVHAGDSHLPGEAGGEENHTLTGSEMPGHTHAPSLSASTADAELKTPTGSRPAVSVIETYSNSNLLVPLHPQAVTGNAGGSQPHPNVQPFLTLNFIIALQGIFPSQN